MKGMIEGAMPQGQPMKGEDLEAPMEEAEGEDKDFDRFMLAVQKVLYDSEASDSLAEDLATSQDIPKTLADVAYDVFSTVDEKSGGMLPDEAVAAAAIDTLGMIAEMAGKVGKKPSGADLAQAAKLMIERYFTESGASPEELQMLMGSIDMEGAARELDGGGMPEEPVAPEEMPA